MAKSCWQWIDWTPCYAAGDTLNGNTVELVGWCPVCSQLRLRAPGFGYPDPDWGTPHFKPDFKGMVKMVCREGGVGCHYEGSFYVNVPSRKVFLAREICSGGLV